MGVNTKIYLPLHVRSDHVLQVIGKLAGEPWEVVFDGNPNKKGRVDPESPTSAENDWKIQFQGHHATLKVHPSDMFAELGRMLFTDASGEAHAWYWHAETEEEKWKLLSPGSHALAVSVGKRLIEFFGGEICYADTTDNIDYRVSNEEARFPQKTLYQTPDDRWYQFQNALHSEPLLTRAELEEAMKIAGGPKNEYAKLMRALDTRKAEELKRKMEEALPMPPNTAPKHKPVGRF